MAPLTTVRTSTLVNFVLDTLDAPETGIQMRRRPGQDSSCSTAGSVVSTSALAPIAATRTARLTGPVAGVRTG